MNCIQFCLQFYIIIEKISTGGTNQSIKEIIDYIIEEGLKVGIHFQIIATDIETGTNASHSEFFFFKNQILGHWMSGTIIPLMEKIPTS